ncbi:hypothetical protein [Nostoc sp. LEGE 12450]|uniref:hypothetical protein n=1 Tax=Nostoc sp. LEGE 12450 TaxID=1828643 RepID=UPI0018802F25|nr:hypothetical protein [Nostoc sp. LEGE 12450]MBE8991319.1 hypothetical protein [Nostoc sp. LEGE 12450]
MSVKLRQLHQVASRNSSVDWLLQGLGILLPPYLSSLHALLLAAVEREYNLVWKQQK